MIKIIRAENGLWTWLIEVNGMGHATDETWQNATEAAREASVAFNWIWTLRNSE
jgi:hypothetical protein